MRHRIAPNFSKEPHVLAHGRSCHNPYFHDGGFIEIGAGFIVHGFSLLPARRFLIMDFRAGYSSNGEPQKITMYSPGRRRQFYNFIVSNGTFFDSREIIKNLL